MNWIRRLITRLVPRSWAADMEAESRAWMLRGRCGHERSIWDAGGIRWKAAGSPRRLMRCPDCREWSWHTVYRRRRDDRPAGGSGGAGASDTSWRRKSRCQPPIIRGDQGG